MFKTVRFVVVPWVRRKGDLVRDEARQFYTRDEAVRLADRLRRKLERVDVYEVAGWPVQELWDRPRKVG